MKSKIINKPSISVLMSAYNSEKYIAEAIESILNQTFKDFEFIIFDDGSEDKTKQIIQKYAKKDKRIIPIYNKCNIGYKGFIRNLNRGLKMAKGKYIARMDADDISIENRFQIQYDFLKKNTEIFLVGGSFRYIDENSKILYQQINNFSPEVIAKKLPYKSMVHHPTVMFRNKGKIYYREKAIYCEDRDLWLRFLTDNKKMIVLPNILINYRIHGNSICTNNNNKQMIAINEIIKWYFERKKYGREISYQKFDPTSLINKYSEKSEQISDSIKLKFLYKSKKNKEFRSELRKFWMKNGVSKWPISIFYYFLSFI
ncbi:Glycosyltransferase AglG [uncultured archaeon]|nr:Glycosyltransferase AglG [uncultured archaeon]